MRLPNCNDLHRTIVLQTYHRHARVFIPRAPRTRMLQTMHALRTSSNEPHRFSGMDRSIDGQGLRFRLVWLTDPSRLAEQNN
jgi:hypothetical protein